MSPGASVAILDEDAGKRPAPRVYQVFPEALRALSRSRTVYAHEAARTRDSQADWPLLYNRRAGIEGTLSQGVRGFGMRRSRYINLAKTHLQHIFIATAMNLWRIVDWLNEVPLAKTRQAAFVRLMPQITT